MFSHDELGRFCRFKWQSSYKKSTATTNDLEPIQTHIICSNRLRGCGVYCGICYKYMHIKCSGLTNSKKRNPESECKNCARNAQSIWNTDKNSVFPPAIQKGSIQQKSTQSTNFWEVNTINSCNGFTFYYPVQVNSNKTIQWRLDQRARGDIQSLLMKRNAS